MGYLRSKMKDFQSPYFKQITKNKGFTLVELMMVGLIISLITGGVWAVYFSIVNVYYGEQRDALIQSEGEWLIDLITNGGHFKGNRIYGLNSAADYSGSIKVGQRSSPSSEFDNDSDDYRIEFRPEDSGSNPRYAEFSVEFSESVSPTSKLWFRLRAPSGSADENYDVLLTENLLMRRYDDTQNPANYGNYNKTWFKADELPSSGSYISGVKVSFYLVDNTQPIQYNYRLDRELINPISDPAQKQSFLGGIPYPQFFSTTVYFPNRVD